MNISKILIGFSFISIFFAIGCKEKPTESVPIVTSITGKVFDKQTTGSLPGVNVVTIPTTSSNTTDANGNYTIKDIKPGQYTVSASKDGYNTGMVIVEVAEGKTVNADINLDIQKPELAVTAEYIDFDISDNVKTFTISNKTKIGSVNWQITSNKNWCVPSPSSGTVTTDTKIITLTANRDSLKEGNYAGEITITSDAGNKTIIISVTKLNLNAPQLTVSPPIMDYGKSQSTANILVKNSGTGSLNWTLTKTDSWILTDATSGSVLAGSPSTITVSVDRTGKAVNNYSGSVTINSNGGSQTVIIKMEVATGVLAAPRVEVLSKTETTVNLGWTQSTEANFVNYKVYRSAQTGVNEMSTLVATFANSINTNYTDTGLPSGSTYYYRVYAYNASGIGSASNEVAATTTIKLGAWSVVNKVTGASKMTTVSDNNIWVFGDTLYNWINNSGKGYSRPASAGKIYMTSFISQNLGYAAGAKSLLLKYDGIKWSEITGFTKKGDTWNLSGIAALSETNIWAVYSKASTNSIITHFDGTTWTEVPLNSKAPAVYVKFFSASLGYVVCQDGSIWKYNGGSWTNIATYTLSGYSANNEWIQNAVVLDDNNIWMTYTFAFVGAGKIIKYNGSGFTEDWKNSYSPARDPSGIDMSLPTSGWSGGYQGVIMYFNGTSWEKYSSPTSSSISQIDMISQTIGWGVCYDGTIIRYQ